MYHLRFVTSGGLLMQSAQNGLKTAVSEGSSDFKTLKELNGWLATVFQHGKTRTMSSFSTEDTIVKLASFKGKKALHYGTLVGKAARLSVWVIKV